MDDEELYGPEFHRLGFGEAVDMGILTDYKVVILDVDMEQVGVDLERILSDEEVAVSNVPRVGQKSLVKITLTLDNSARMVGCWNGLRKLGITPDEFLYDPAPSSRAVAFTNTVNQSLRVLTLLPAGRQRGRKGQRFQSQLSCGTRRWRDECTEEGHST